MRKRHGEARTRETGENPEPVASWTPSVKQ